MSLRPSPSASRPARRSASWLSGLGLLALTVLAAARGGPADDPAEAGAPSEAGAAPLHLVVLHSNDVHGQALPHPGEGGDAGGGDELGGLERLAEEIARIRAEHTGPDRALLVLDGGDWWQGTPEGALDGGLPFVRALGSIGYDAMALGNHEFDLGTAPLERMLEAVDLPAVAANVRVAEGGERVDWVEPWRIVERGGLRIALVGLLYEQTPFITHPDARDLHFTDEVTELGRVLAELPDDVDLVIPLTHCGVEVDRELAAAFGDLPLIVGGHSHTWLRGGQRVGDVLVAQAGSKARALGRVDLIVDRASGEVLESSARLIELDRPLPGERRRADVGERVAALAAASEAALGEEVGELAGPLVDQRRFGSSSVGNWITDAFRAGVESDLAVHNRGGIRARLEPGAISRRDLFELLPFPNTLVAIELTGAELERCLRGALVGRRESRLEVSGITLVVDLDAEGRVTGLVVEHAGAPLEPDRRYRVATNSYLAQGGDNLFALERALDPLDTGVLLRDLLERDLREADGAFRPADDDRYRIVDPR